MTRLALNEQGLSNSINPFKLSVLFMGHAWANSEEPDQMLQSAVSDQVLHCLLTEYTFKRIIDGLGLIRLFF